MYSKNPKENKGIPTLRETRFATTDNRYLEGDGEEEFLASQVIAQEQTEEEEMRLSYESDGKMGKQENTIEQANQDPDVRQKDFFNTTQSSE
jgi:hypothetical protein